MVITDNCIIFACVLSVITISYTHAVINDNFNYFLEEFLL